MKPYCVYLITYQGDKLSPLYLGSTSRKRLAGGYWGSVSSKLYRETWKLETRTHPELFSARVLSEHDTRKEALEHELQMGEALDTVKDPRFANRSLACPDGFFGMDTSGDKHPLFGVGHTQDTRDKMARSWTPERRSKAAAHAKDLGKAFGPTNGKYERTVETRRRIKERENEQA